MTIQDDPSPIYASPMDVETYRIMGLDQPAPNAVNGHGRYAPRPEHVDDAYEPCPEAFPGEGVAEGTLVSLKAWDGARQYPGTRRDLRFYVSADAPGEDLNLMVFNDGAFYVGRNGPVRATRVLDVLRASGELGPTLAVFVNPGIPRELPDELTTQAERDVSDEQRSIEYDVE